MTSESLELIFNDDNYHRLKKYLVHNEDIIDDVIQECRENDLLHSAYIDTKIKVDKYHYINVRICNSMTNVCISVQINELNVIKKFFAKKKIQSTYSSTIFIESMNFVRQNRVDMIQCLVEYDLQNSIPYLECLYTYACRCGNVDMVMYLYDYVNNEKVVLDGLRNACRFGASEVIDALLSVIDDKIIDYATVFFDVVGRGDIKNVQIAIAYYPVNNDTFNIVSSNALLFEAMRNDFADIVELLVSHGAIITNINNDDFVDCMRANNVSVMEFAINKLNQERISELFIKSKYCSVEMVELLIEAGVDVDKYCKQLYLESMECGNKHLANYLCKML